MPRRVVAPAVIAAFLAAAPAVPAAPAPVGGGAGSLTAFGDCSTLMRYARRHLPVVHNPASDWHHGGVPAVRSGIPTPLRGVPDAGGSAGSAAGGSSATNVQEANVDEPDVVKSRGSTILAIAGDQLHAVDAGAPQPRLLDSLQLTGWEQELLVHGPRALVIANSEGADYSDQTVLTEVDISDPSHLRVVRTETIEGFYVTARLSGSTARIVTSAIPRALYEPRLRGRVAGWRPSSTLRDAATGRTTRRPLGSCRSIRHPRVFSGLGVLTVLTVDMSKGLPAVDSDSVLTDAEFVYASKSNLYVTSQRSLPDLASLAEPPSSTAIHKFDASQPGHTSYLVSGSVRGSLLSQWSMSDSNGVLRVATTDSPEWAPASRPSESFVTTLADRGRRLAEVGRVGGIGLGERIYAVRFIGDLAYVVTFREVDPLHIVDLSNPEHPRVAGELKLQGYSAYLHPVGDNLLLGVGQDVGKRGAALGTQASLFDVSDPSHPVRLSHRTIASSESDVEYDPHAFLWWAPASLAVLPIDVWSPGDNGFTGAVGLRAGRDTGVAEAGRTSHPGEYAPISRSLVVAGRLFTLSDSGLQMNSLDTLASQAWVAFPQPPPIPIDVRGGPQGGGRAAGRPTHR